MEWAMESVLELAWAQGWETAGPRGWGRGGGGAWGGGGGGAKSGCVERQTCQKLKSSCHMSLCPTSHWQELEKQILNFVSRLELSSSIWSCLLRRLARRGYHYQWGLP